MVTRVHMIINFRQKLIMMMIYNLLVFVKIFVQKQEALQSIIIVQMHFAIDSSDFLLNLEQFIRNLTGMP